MAAYGFVYMLTNPFMPTLVKVGFATRSPRARADELSQATGVPVPFEVYGYIEVTDPSGAEALAHRHFARNRISPEREFFVAADRLAFWKILTDVLCDNEVQICPGEGVSMDEYETLIRTSPVEISNPSKLLLVAEQVE